MGNSVRFKASLDDKVSGKLGKIRDDFDRLGKSKGAQSIIQGVGVGAGITAFGLLSSAVSGVVSAFADGVRGAIEEEAGIARLTASINANVAAWDGNLDAIESVIAARVQLGFADDEQRDSLSRLVVATNDVNAALELQRTAMDLARLKGISLAEASDALIKVESGQFRALKALGIVLEEGATQTEALAAVQAAATGQAEKYAETTAGKLVVAQTEFNEQMEKAGATAIPLVTGALDVLNTAVDALNATVYVATAGWREHEAAAGEVALTIENNTDALRVGEAAWGTYAQSVMLASGQIDESMITSRKEAEQTSLVMFRAGERIQAASDETKDEVVADNRKIKRSYRDVADYLLDQYSDNYDTAMGIIEARADLHNAKTAADRAEARAELAQFGALSAEGYDKWVRNLERLAKGTKGKVHENFMDAIRDVQALKAAAQGEIKVKVSYTTSGKVPKPGQAAEPRAGGGPVTANRPYIVGEDGPELFVPKASGTVIPNEPTEMLAPTRSRFTAASGSPVVVQVNMDGREIARIVDRHLYYEAARAPRSSLAG